VGTYGYGAKPHAVTSVTGGGNPNTVTANYQYDPNGNLTGASGTIYSATTVAFSRALTYMSFNMPRMLCEGRGTGASATVTGTTCQATGAAVSTYTYTYSAEHERIRLVTVRPGDTLTTIYLHPGGSSTLLYEEETKQSTGVIERKHYIAGGSGIVGVHIT